MMAKTHLSKLIAAVEKGEEITILRRDKPVAELKAIPQKKGRQLGGLAHIKVDLSIFEDHEIDSQIEHDFYGEDSE